MKIKTFLKACPNMHGATIKKNYTLMFDLQKFSVMHISITKEILDSG
jgi:hypothetical protein